MPPRNLERTKANYELINAIRACIGLDPIASKMAYKESSRRRARREYAQNQTEENCLSSDLQAAE